MDLAEDGALDGVIDLDKVAVVGHSYGGTTALSVAGARVKLDWLDDACVDVEDPFVEGMFCSVFSDGRDDLIDGFGLEAEPAGLWPSLADDRVDAIVGIAPDAFMLGPEGLAEIEIPTPRQAGCCRWPSAAGWPLAGWARHWS